MKEKRETRCDVLSVELLRELIDSPLPFNLAASPPTRTFVRDLYLDTPGGDLRRQGVICRFRSLDDERQRLSVVLPPARPRGPETLSEADVDTQDALRAVTGRNAPARQLRRVVEPELLEIAYAVHSERVTRVSQRGLLRGAQFQFTYDTAIVELAGVTRGFQELRVRRIQGGSPSLAKISDALCERYGVRPILESRVERERQIADALVREGDRRGVSSGRAVALVAYDHGAIACRSQQGTLRLPTADGSGEGACRHLLQEQFGSSVGELRMLGTVPGDDATQELEVWLARHMRQGRTPEAGTMLWLSLDELIARVGSGALRDRQTLASLLLVARSDLRSMQTPSAVAPVRVSKETRRSVPVEKEDGEREVDDRFLDADRSLVEFNARVLAMAEDPRTPLLERLQYLAIVSANCDEFFSVRVSAIKRQGAEVTGEHRGIRAEEQLAMLGPRLRALETRQQETLRACFADLAPHGVRILSWHDLDDREQDGLARHFNQVIFPALTPKAVTEAPGFPQPAVPTLSLMFAVLVKDPQTGPLHLGYVRVPEMMPRLVPIRDDRTFVPLEEVIREHIDALYPGRSVLQAHLFRVTRSGELDAEESSSGDLLQAIEEDAKRRGSNAVVRVEVEKSMPATLRKMLLDELRFDTAGEPLPLGVDEVYEIDGPLDLTMLRQLAGLPLPDLRFPPPHSRVAFLPERSIFATIKERDRLVHHPYEDFASSVQRFIEEAADDPDVTTIKATLYRAGERSPIVDALVRAALAGKDVAAFVELKARFDEARNVVWARRLTEAGVHVVYGLVGLKNHAKMTLVVRRESDALRRYVHIGTGNYNASTARFYTDIGLFSCNESLGADVNDLFNELTGSSRWPRGTYRKLLVAPHAMLPGLLARVAREIEHAKAGRPSGIRLKLNGLSDIELIEALYRASEAGVNVDLIVRGLCRLRPGVPGMSERIRVFSILGRYLEHARIYAFENGGQPEYLIGSADWRSRNVRRRVEALAPVLDAECQARLDMILRRELNDPSAWLLDGDGEYRRRSAAPDTTLTAQALFATEVAAAPGLAPV